MFNVALVGAGRIGQIHARNVMSHPSLQLAAIVEPVQAAAEALAAAAGAQVRDLEDVLQDVSIAGVVIASATDTHLDYSIRALARGKVVFCEKPIDLDLSRAQSAKAAFEKSHGRMFLGFNRRFDPNFQRLKQGLDAGEVGDLETLHIISHDPAPPPPSYIQRSGGLFKDMTIHDFDMARWLMPEEPIEIFASATCLVDPAIAAAGDVDTAKILLRTASGRLCVISNSRRSGYGYDQRIEAFGARGALRADNERESTVSVWREVGTATDPFLNFFLDRYAEAYRREISHFADILAGASVPSAGYADGIAALALAEAAAESVKLGRPVRLQP